MRNHCELCGFIDGGGNFSNNRSASRRLELLRKRHAYETFHYGASSLLPRHCTFQVLHRSRYSITVGKSSRSYFRDHFPPRARATGQTFPISFVTRYRAYRETARVKSQKVAEWPRCYLRADKSRAWFHHHYYPLTLKDYRARYVSESNSRPSFARIYKGYKYKYKE